MRSGTSLVSHILDAHSRIAVFYESYLYNYFNSNLRFYGDLNKPANRRRLIADVREAIVTQKVEPPLAEEIETALPNRTFAGVFAAVLHLYARSKGKKRAGDKTPDHHLHLAEIQRDFPQSPVVFVLRDPRDTALSLRKAFNFTLEAAAHSWNEAFASYEQAREKVYALRYETLVRDPQTTIEELCHAVGETFEPSILRFFEAVPERLRREEMHQKLTRAIDASSVGKFAQMPAEEIQKIEEICAKGMAALGYAFTTAARKRTTVAVKPPTFLRRLIDRFRYYGFHPGRWRPGMVRWRQLARMRARYWLALGPLRSGY